MPMPDPMGNESKQDFIARFMADEAMSAEFPEESRRLGVAYSRWQAAHRSVKGARPTKGVPYVVYDVAKLKDVSPESGNGVLAGYASTWDHKDLESDVIVKGAFLKTLSERGAAGRIPLMTVHLAHGGGPEETIGWMNQDSKEDNNGLWASFDMLDTELAQDMRKAAKSSLELGYPFGLSVEFIPIVVDNMPGGGAVVREARLLQVTLTSAPMNEVTSVTEVKDASGAAAAAADTKTGKSVCVAPVHVAECNSRAAGRMARLAKSRREVSALVHALDLGIVSPGRAGRTGGSRADE